jgi:hypothetical protein
MKVSPYFCPGEARLPGPPGGGHFEEISLLFDAVRWRHTVTTQHGNCLAAGATDDTRLVDPGFDPAARGIIVRRVRQFSHMRLGMTYVSGTYLRDIFSHLDDSLLLVIASEARQGTLSHWISMMRAVGALLDLPRPGS